MGFGGSAAAMIASIKNNNLIRKKRTHFDKDSLGGYGNGEKVEFNFPEVTPEILRNIRDRLQKERRELLLKRGILFFVITIVLILIVIF